MPRKTEAQNLGLPLFVNPAADLVAKPKVSPDSWYVVCAFQHGAKQLGFEWHQQLVSAGEGVIGTVEFLVMDGERRLFVPTQRAEPAGGAISASSERLEVRSSLGVLEGDRQTMTLRLTAERSALDVRLRPREQVLCNGGTGLLKLMGCDSYEYAFPNMDVEGTLTIEGETFEIAGATAWFDRQWSYNFSQNDLLPENGNVPPSWLWLGMPLGDGARQAISLWDLTQPGTGRRCFATILDDQGLQTNHLANVTYEDIWKSPSTGNHYPRRFRIEIGTAKLDLNFTAVFDRPEFDHGKKSISGCQSLCHVVGHYGEQAIDAYVIVELIGDVCGDLN